MIYKMYCIVSEEALSATVNGEGEFIRGKFGAQCGHAFLHAWWDAERRFPEDAAGYRNSQHAFKIVLKVKTTDELKRFEEAYRDVCGISLVTDAGFTVFNEPTTTCLGLGPIREDLIGKDLKRLRTLT